MTDHPSGPSPEQDELKTIGDAFLQEDGTLVMRLRAESPIAVGDALFKFAPDDPKYSAMLDHIGGLEPGETKAVPAFN